MNGYYIRSVTWTWIVNDLKYPFYINAFFLIFSQYIDAKGLKHVIVFHQYGCFMSVVLCYILIFI